MNYIGSKYSLLDFLHKTISDITGFKNGNGLVFADLFAGTGVVGASFREKGWTVISNDIQYYSYILNKHYIENIIDNICTDKDYFNGIKESEGFVYNNYCEGSGSGRMYFTDGNGKKCDAIREKIELLHINGEINDSEYYYYLASLINTIDKYANTASVYGAFLKKIKKSAAKDMELEYLPIINGPIGKVYNKEINSLISEIKGDVLYLDPPYNERQYCTNYHVLETIARCDNPELYGKTGLRKCEEQKSLFCSRKTVINSFDYLISHSKFKYIFLSYNNEGLMTIDEIKNIMSKYGNYSFYTKEYHRFKADKDENRNIKSEQTLEYLHCLYKEI